ncbi:hypothetical protein [Candidatus Palauibacter sp.]|uniref:hypothetical protein n=1 Tax=Candidatus Palauibacter sp. TaxID=3101350 RepID=UPI003AF303DC
MDRVAKWVSGASLAWLLMAVGLILGTHGGSAHGAQVTGAPEEPTTVVCPKIATAEIPATLTTDDFRRS